MLPTPTRRSIRWLAVVPLVFTAIACSSNNDDAAPTTTTTPATSTAATNTTAVDSLAKAADQACAKYQAVIADNGPFPLSDFDPKHPQADQLPTVGNHFLPVVQATKKQVDVLEALAENAPPNSDFVAFVNALKAENDNAAKQANLAIAKDVDGFVSTLDDSDTTGATRIAAAKKLGAPNCVKP